MDLSSLDNELETKEQDSKVADTLNIESEELKRKRMESIGELETEGEEAQGFMSDRSGYLHIPYGFQSRGSYKHASKNCEIVGGINFFDYIYFFIFLFF